MRKNINNMPLVSIITPSYNSKKYFTDTYKSVIFQTFKNFEWIIIDDCSTDGSYEFIKKIIKGDSRIKLLKTNKNGGTGVARNVGLKNANGRYITFLDSDDILDNNYLEKQIEFIKTNGPLISAGYRRKTLKTCTDFYVPNIIDYKTDLKGNPLSCLTTMYDKQIIGDVLFPENYKKVEDYIFWLEILKKGIVAKGNHQILASYIIRPDSRSRNKVKLIKYMYRVYHNSQKLNFIKSWYYVLRWALYGVKKYRNVK